MLRVIGGRARGRRLRSPGGRSLRPTADRVREALFDILAPRVPDARFLDLYAGTGAVAIEALSRGSASAVLVESGRSHAALARENLAICGMERRARLLVTTARAAISRLAAAGERFELVFADPPYRAAGARRAMVEALCRLPLLPPGGRLILEGPSREEPPPGGAGLELLRQETYGETRLTFYGPRGGKSPPAGAAGAG